MEQIPAPKKERRFLKGLGEIALVLIRELVLGIGKKVINKVGNKREKLVIAIIILASSIAFAQYPATANKQRLGYQTTGDGLVFRGRSNDTMSLKPSTINNAYHIFDTVNNVLFSYIKTKGGWKFNNSDTVIINNTIDTTSLSSRISLKVNISDTASMLTNYLRSGVAASTYTPLTRSISTTAPLSGGGDLSANRTFSIPQSSGSVNGYLSSTDWTTFNGKGSGTVTSVGLTAPSLFTVSGSPVTTSGTLAITYSGDALPLANGGTGATTQANARITLGGTTSGISLFTLTNSTTDKFIKVNSNNTITLLSADDTRTTIGAGTGSVTSVGMSVPSFLSVSGSPVTSSGTLAVSLSGTPLPVLNGGTGGANETDARNNLGAACKSCTETLTGNKTFSGTVTLSSVSGTATSVIGRSSTGQVVGVSFGTAISLVSGALTVQDAGASQSGLLTSTTQIFGGNKTFNGSATFSGGVFGTIEKKTGSTVGSFDAIDANTLTYIFEHTGSGSGSVILDYLDLPSNQTNRIINIVNVSTNAWDLQFDTRKPYTKTSTQITTLSSGQKITVQSDGSKWWVISSNF